MKKRTLNLIRASIVSISLLIVVLMSGCKNVEDTQEIRNKKQTSVIENLNNIDECDYGIIKYSNINGQVLMVYSTSTLSMSGTYNLFYKGHPIYYNEEHGYYYYDSNDDRVFITSEDIVNQNNF